MKRLANLFLKDVDRLTQGLIQEYDTSYIDEQMIERSIKIYQNQDPNVTPNQFTDSFFTRAKKSTTWIGKLRVLLVIHKIMHSLDSKYADNFTKIKLPDFKPQQPSENKESIEAVTHNSLVQYYQSYLTKLLYNYDEFKAIFDSSVDLPHYLASERLSVLHLLSKAQNLLCYLLKTSTLFEVSLIRFPNQSIVKQAAYYILTDCSALYEFINSNISRLIDKIFDLASEEAVFLYEIYAENVQVTRKLKAFMDLKNHLDDFDCMEPEYFKINPEINKKVELYINSIKPKSSRLGAGLISNSSRNTIKSTRNTRDANSLYLEDFNTEPDCEGVAKHGLSITTSNFCQASSRAIFQAPHKIPASTRSEVPNALKRNDSPLNSRGEGQYLTERALTAGDIQKYKPLKAVLSHITPIKGLFNTNIKSIQNNNYQYTDKLAKTSTPNESFTDSFITPPSNYRLRADDTIG